MPCQMESERGRGRWEGGRKRVSDLMYMTHGTVSESIVTSLN